MIPARTWGAMFLLAVAVAVAAARGVLDPAHIAGLRPAACLFAGLFASLGAALLAWRWRFHQRAIALLALFAVGLIAFDDRASARLAELPERASFSLTEYCPDEPEAPERAEPAPARAAQPRGCALIRRAYELGYADSLGACAPEDEPETAAKPGRERRICRLRRRDEPLLHYLWRTLRDRAGSVAEPSQAQSLARGAAELEVRLGYLDTLFARQAHAISATAHASHHLFTNLPPPRQRSWAERLLAGERCGGGGASPDPRLSWEEHPAPASGLVEHALSRLLFDPSLGSRAGSCAGYTIHWGAPADACAELADNPAGFLAREGALEPVRAVLDRRRHQVELRALAAELGQEPREPPPAASEIVSFQCYVAAPGGAKEPREHALSLDGHTLRARSLRTPEVRAGGAAQLEVYEDLTLLLAGVRYSGPVAESGGTVSVPPTPTPGDIEGADYTLAKMELLREADPFLGAGWPLSRPDLIEIYPFHHHLRHLAQVFRRSYRLQRGRL